MGNGKTTLDDLARLAGVSASTVSRALHDHPLISIKTKQRIWALAREHDYPFRTSMAVSPVGGTGAVAIVTPHVRGRALPLSHPFFLELIAGIGEAARARDCDFTVSHVAPENFDDLVTASTSSRADGIIFLGQGELHEPLNQLTETDANFVVWGAQMPRQRYRSIGSDNLLGGRRATLHLARLGRRRIAFVGGADPETSQRRQGYLAALAEAGLNADPALQTSVEFELDSADAVVSQMLREGVAFDGVVAASDIIALGALQAIQRAGRSVPGDISVVGYDDMLLSRLSSPKLTTIRQDVPEAGRLLVATLFEPGRRETSALLPTELVVRESCGG